MSGEKLGRPHTTHVLREIPDDPGHYRCSRCPKVFVDLSALAQTPLPDTDIVIPSGVLGEPTL